MSEAPKTFMPGEVPTIAESKADEAERIRAAIRKAGCQVGALLSDKIRALMEEMEVPMNKMHDHDPNAKDRLHQAWSILRSVLVEADEWASRIKALNGEPSQEPADPSPVQSPTIEPVRTVPTPVPTSHHPPFVPTVTNPPANRPS